MRIKEVGYIVERLADRFRDLGGQMVGQEASHKTALTELRASFNARTGADEKIIEGLRIQVQDMREEIIRVNEAHGRTKVENDGLLDELAAQRDAFTAEVRRIRRELCGGCDALRAEVERLMAQTPKHPVKVGEWVRRTKLPGAQSPVGIVKQVTVIRCDGDSYGFADGDFWSVDNCKPCTHQHPAQDGQWVRRTVASGTEPVGTMIQVQRSRTLHSEYVTRGAQVVPWAHCEPCDPPATHDTPEGRSVAESVIRDGRKTEPVADELKVGDIIEVVSATHKLYTEPEDIGRRGIVTVIDGMRLSVSAALGYQLPIRGIVGKCDVRKVTT